MKINENKKLLQLALNSKNNLTKTETALTPENSYMFDSNGFAINTNSVYIDNNNSYDIYDKMMLDSNIALCMESLVDSILSMEYSIMPENPEDTQQQEMADYVSDVFNKFTNFNKVLQNILTYLQYGISYNEILWRDNYTPYDVYFIHPRRIKRKINADGSYDLYLFDKNHPIDGKKLRTDKYLVVTNGDLPYGKSILDKVYLQYLLKKLCVENNAKFGETLATPTLLAELINGIKEDEIEELIASIEAGQQTSVITYEKKNINSIDILEANTGNVSKYFLDNLQYLDDSVVKSLLHQMASTEGTPGKLGQEDVQNQTKTELAISIASTITPVLNGLIKQICDYKYFTNENTVYPKIVFSPSVSIDKELTIKIIDTLAKNFDMEFSKEQLRDILNIAAPTSEEDTLLPKSQSDIMPEFDEQPELDEDMKLQESAKTKRGQTDIRNMKRKQDEEYKKSALNAIELAYSDINDYLINTVKDARSFNKLKGLQLSEPIKYKIGTVFANYNAFISWQSRVALDLMVKKAQKTQLAENDFIVDIGINEAIPEDEFWVLKTPESIINYFSTEYAIDEKSAKRIIKQSERAGVRIGKEENEYFRKNWSEIIETAIKTGVTLEQFKADFAKNVDKYVETMGISAAKPYHVETIYRTNLADAWETTKVNEIRQDELIKEFFPYLQYIAIVDSRTDANDKALNGYIARADDNIWQSITPPNHYNCRCTIRPVSAVEYGEIIQGIDFKKENKSKIKGYKPQIGFEKTRVA